MTGRELYEREESEGERLDRNWTEMLQELRVTQTGTQILTGFLLTLAFTPRFTELDDYQRDIYLILLVLATLATGLALAPVILHRSLFRKHAKDTIVSLADVLIRVALTCGGLLLGGIVLFMFDVVLGRAAGFIAGGCALVVAILLWVAIPLNARRLHRGESSTDDEASSPR